MNFGFSYVGLIFLVMLMVPNLLWTKNQPENYEKYSKNENKILQILERIGEAAVSCLILIFSDFNIKKPLLWLMWLALAFVLMLMYEAYWVRYFRSEKTMNDFWERSVRD